MVNMSEVSDSSAPAAVDSSSVDNVEIEGNEEGQDNAAPVQPSKRKYKYKADGQEFEEELDESEIGRRLSLSKAAYKRMEEASKTQKQAEQFVKMLQEDPMRILSNPQVMGNEKFRELAENFLAKQLEDQMLSPEQKQQREMQERLKKYEDAEKEQKTKAEQEQMLKLQEHYQQDYEQKIIKGLQSQNLPKTAKTVRRMAELMAKSAEHGIDLQPEHLAELVKADYVNEMREMFGSTEGDVLLNLLGDEVGNKIRKADLAKLRGNTGFNQPKTSSSNSESPNQTKKIRASEYDAHLKRKLGIK